MGNVNARCWRKCSERRISSDSFSDSDASVEAKMMAATANRPTT